MPASKHMHRPRHIFLTSLKLMRLFLVLFVGLVAASSEARAQAFPALTQAKAQGQEPFTRQELLQYLEDNVRRDTLAHHDADIEKAVKLIEKRGVAFKLAGGFDAELQQAADGASSLYSPIRNNFRRPGSATPNAKTEPQEETTSPTPTTIGGSGLLTREAILQHLRTNLGTDRRNWRRQDEVNKELVEAVKQRGVDFKYDIVRDSPALQNLGADSNLRAALNNNPGIPAKLGFLVGTWETTAVGQTQYTDRDGVATVDATGGRSGFFTINAERTYLWNAPTGVFEGSWRNATSQEMQNDGGAGIVLLDAYGGFDWIVIKNNNAKAGDQLTIARVDNRPSFFYGVRKR